MSCLQQRHAPLDGFVQRVCRSRVRSRQDDNVSSAFLAFIYCCLDAPACFFAVHDLFALGVPTPLGRDWSSIDDGVQSSNNPLELFFCVLRRTLILNHYTRHSRLNVLPNCSLHVGDVSSSSISIADAWYSLKRSAYSVRSCDHLSY